MSPSQWGPPTWVFIHTLADKIKEDHFNVIGKPVIYNILQICNNLPCPECSDHAKQFWSKVNINNVNTILSNTSSNKRGFKFIIIRNILFKYYIVYFVD